MTTHGAGSGPIVPVVLSGGAGTRLWPVSREGYPKPFMKLPDGQSLLGKTISRAATLSGAAPVLLVTNRDYYFDSRDEVTRALGPTAAGNVHYLLEPASRNTAAAVATAARWVCQHVSPDAVMLVMPADHLISPIEQFVHAAHQAAELAQQGRLITFGVRPTRPETGYGYIETGEPLADNGACRVERFIEKPDPTTAAEFLRRGTFLWNSGMFGLRAQTLLDELAIHRPQLAEAVNRCWDDVMAAAPTGPYTELPAASFAELESISIDYAVMEPSRQLAVLPASFTWDDIGSWNSVASLVPEDGAGNRVHGDAILVDSANCFVRAEDRVIAAVGLRGIMVVDTPDALLVADAGSAQHVKEVVSRLKQRGHESYRLHRTVLRPWGTYTVLEEGEGYKIKRLEVKPGGKLSLQMHYHRSEHWIVVSGTARVECDGESRLVMTNESAYIPVGKAHRVENPGQVALVMIEVQSGTYLGEDDIVRFSDAYGRAPAAG